MDGSARGPRVRLFLLATSCSAALFGVAAVPAGAVTLNFSPVGKFDVGAKPGSIATDDFNGDGKPDLVTANSRTDDVSVLLGRGDGSFERAEEFAVDYDPSLVVSGDVNGDGDPDLVTVNHENLSVLLGDGQGSFGPREELFAGDAVTSVGIADMNGDGDVDLVTRRNYEHDGTYWLALGDGAGSFDTATVFEPDLAALDLLDGDARALGDLNGDAILDRAAPDIDNDEVEVRFGTGGGLGPPSYFSVGPPGEVTGFPTYGPAQVAIDDFDADGAPDLVTGNIMDQSIAVLLGDDSGSFAPATRFDLGGSPSSLVTADFNGDGRPDVATADHYQDDARVLLNCPPGCPDPPDPEPEEPDPEEPVEPEPEPITLIEFSPAKAIGVDDHPRSVVIGDLNGDGHRDLVSANLGNSNVSVLLGDGSGSFGAATEFPVGDNQWSGSPRSLAIGDLDNDGDLDLVTANAASNNVSVLLGDGTGDFATRVNFAVGSNPGSVAIGDLDSDGIQDLVTAQPRSDDVSILRGRGGGTFAAATQVPAGNGPVSVAIRDLNDDGKLDLATANYFGDDVSILPGDGQGSFGAPTHLAAGDGPKSVEIGDLDGSGGPDLVTANKNSGDVSILLGAGNGSFAAASNFSAGPGLDPQFHYPGWATIRDLNLDGVADLAVSTDSSPEQSVSVLIGEGGGSFEPVQRFATDGYAAPQVTTGDLNEDGWPDLVTTDGFNSVMVLLNCSECSEPPRPGPVEPGPLELSGLLLEPQRFAASSPKGSARKQKGPAGTVVRVVLNRDAAVRFTIRRRTSRSGARAWRFTRPLSEGKNLVRFSGTVRGRALNAGRYKLSVKALDGSLRSNKQSVGFTILER